MLSWLAHRHRLVFGGAAQRDDAFPQHQSTDRTQEHHVEQRDDQIELTKPAQHREDLDAHGGAGQTADQKHKPEFDIKRSPAEMRQRT